MVFVQLSSAEGLLETAGKARKRLSMLAGAIVKAFFFIIFSLTHQTEVVL